MLQLQPAPAEVPHFLSAEQLQRPRVQGSKASKPLNPATLSTVQRPLTPLNPSAPKTYHHGHHLCSMSHIIAIAHQTSPENLQPVGCKTSKPLRPQTPKLLRPQTPKPLRPLDPTPQDPTCDLQPVGPCSQGHGAPAEHSHPGHQDIAGQVCQAGRRQRHAGTKHVSLQEGDCSSRRYNRRVCVLVGG